VTGQSRQLAFDGEDSPFERAHLGKCGGQRRARTCGPV
jgi:hypothetical protein